MIVTGEARPATREAYVHIATIGDNAGSKRLAILAGVVFVAITTIQFVAARFSLR